MYLYTKANPEKLLCFPLFLCLTPCMTVIFVTILKCMLNIMKVNKDIVIIKLLSVHTVE